MEELTAANTINPRYVFRYAFGAAFIVALAMGFDWFLGFILPVLSLSFLASGDAAPTLKQGISFVLVIAGACIFGVFLSQTTMLIPPVHILITFLVLFHVFYNNNPKFAPMKVWLLIAILLIPNMTLIAKELPVILATSLVVNAFLTIILVWIIFMLIPVKSKSDSKQTAATKAEPPSEKQRFYQALASTFVIMPIFLMFYYFELSGSILILIFVAILSMQPAFAKDFKVGMALIIGNLIGGLVSILAFEILTVVTEFFYLILLVLLAGLLFGKQVFSGKKTAALYGMAFSTFLLVICSVTGSGSNDAGSKVWSRVIQIMIAVVYVVSAFGLLERLKRVK